MSGDAKSNTTDDKVPTAKPEPLSFELRWKKCTDAIIPRLMADQEASRARFASVFVDEPGETAMSYGPDSEEVAEAVGRVDVAIGQLLDRLQDLWPQGLNLIVTSTPGYAKLTPSHLIDLSTYVDPKLWQAVGESPVLNIRPLRE